MTYQSTENEYVYPEIKALAKFLDVSYDDIYRSSYDDQVLQYGSEEYLVLSWEEANERVQEYILDSLWAFDASFLACHIKISDIAAGEKVIRALQEECENCNDTLRELLEDDDKLVSAAISADGLGHFLAHYDGQEHEQDDYLIFRTN
jgi:hypothetical protein